MQYLTASFNTSLPDGVVKLDILSDVLPSATQLKDAHDVNSIEV